MLCEPPPAAIFTLDGSHNIMDLVCSSRPVSTSDFAVVPSLGSTAYREGEQRMADEESLTLSQESPPAAGIKAAKELLSGRQF